MIKIRTCSAGVLIAVVGALPTYAQSSDGLQLEEVVVTAEKRSEDLQKVATSIQVKDGEDLRKTGKKRIDEIMEGTVGVQAQDSQTGVSFFFRGVDPVAGMGVVATPILIDGVAQSRTEAVRGGTLDVAQVEIMRGPQSTTLGANSLAGAVSLVSNKPVFEYQASGTLEVGNYNKLSMEGVLNVPLADNQAIRIAYSSENRDGYLASGAGDSDQKNARVRYRIQPTSDLDITLTASHQLIGGNGVQNSTLLTTGHYEPYTGQVTMGHQVYGSSTPEAGTGCVPVTPLPTGITSVVGCPAKYVLVNDGVDFRHRADAWDDGFKADTWPTVPFRHSKIDQASVEMDWTTALGTVTFQPAYQLGNFKSRENARGTSWMEEDRNEKTVTADLHINSNGNSALQWQAGLYYSHDYYSPDENFQRTVNFPGVGSFTSTGASAVGDCSTSVTFCYYYTFIRQQDRLGQSAYANATYSLADTVRLVGGARYNYDTYDITQLNNVNGNMLYADATELAAATVSASNSGSGKWHKVTYRGGVEWDVLPDAMLYTMYSTGYTPGTVSGGIATKATELEQITAGWKTRLLDNSLQFNTEFFYTTFHNRTVNGSVNAYTAGATDTTCSAMQAGPGGAAVNISADTTYTGEYCASLNSNSVYAKNFLSKGVDMDMTWLISEKDRLTATFEYLNAAYNAKPYVLGYGDITAANVQALAAAQSPSLTVSDTNATALADGINSTLEGLVGAQLQNSPKYSATMEYQHAFVIPNGARITPRVAATYKSRYWSYGGGPTGTLTTILADTSGLYWQPDYVAWDGYTSWDSSDGKYTLTGYVKNIRNEVIMTNFSPSTVSLDAPRTFGMTFTASF